MFKPYVGRIQLNSLLSQVKLSTLVIDARSRVNAYVRTYTYIHSYAYESWFHWYHWITYEKIKLLRIRPLKFSTGLENWNGVLKQSCNSILISWFYVGTTTYVHLHMWKLHTSYIRTYVNVLNIQITLHLTIG